MDGKKRNFFKHYKKIYVNEFKGYNSLKLIKDILAGMTVAAVALPLALAFGAASVGPEYTAVGILAGMITAIVAGIITGALGGGSFQISGPTGAMTVILGGIVGGKYGLQGMFLATFIAGAILLIAGLLRLGKLIQFIPHPVITGFTSGIAVVIAIGQLGNFFGVSLSGETTGEKVAYFFETQLQNINYTALICSAAVVLLMILYPKKLSRYFPGSLASLIVMTAVVAIFSLDVKTIGSIPSTLINTIKLDFGSINLDMIKGVLKASFTIAILGMLESLLCGTCAAGMKKEKFDSNVELIAQGLGNMVVPFLGGVPSTAAIARTSVGIKSGGQTRMTSVFQSLFLIVCIFLLSGVMSAVPYPALAGILAVTAWRMNDWEEIRYFFSKKMWDAVIMFSVTMVATVLLDLTYAILIGVAVSLVFMVNRLSRIKIENVPVEPEQDVPGKKSVIVYSTGALFFANAKELSKIVYNLDKEYNRYIIALRGVVYLDVTAVSELTEMVKRLREEGKTVVFTGVSDQIMTLFEKSGFTVYVGKDNFYYSIDKVLIPHCSTENIAAGRLETVQ